MSVKTIDDLPWAIVQVLTHWKNLDAKLAPGELVLTGNYGRAEMVWDLEALNGLTERIVERQQVHKGLSEDLLAHRKELKEGLRSFVFSVRGLLMGTPFLDLLPSLPDLYAHEDPFMRPMEKAVQVWNQINSSPPKGFAAPLVLASGLNATRFQEKIAAARAAFKIRSESVEEERAIRRQRERLAAQLRDRAIQYHRIVSGSFVGGSEEVRSLPTLWPPTVRKKKESAV
jgi:hypothetical protein